MIIAGNCSYVNEEDTSEILKTAYYLKNVVDWFRCKIWLGGTTPDRYFSGMGYQGIPLLEKINKTIPTMTEIQSGKHIKSCSNLAGIWIGARNSQNYDLLELASEFKGEVFIKRGFGMTTEELCGIFDIMERIHKKTPYIIDRGINTFDRRPDSRWMPDIRNSIELKRHRKDIFNRLVIDCSHSTGHKDYIEDTYVAFKSIGVQHFMFECSYTGLSQTDKNQILNFYELRSILDKYDYLTNKQ